MRIAFFFALLGTLAACGTTSGKDSSPPSTSPTSTSVSGTAGGQTFEAKDAVGLYNATGEY